MKTAKLVIGIITLVLALFVMFQSCAAGIANSLEGNGEVSGTSGLFLAICFIISGILAIATRNKGNGGTYVAAGFYIVGGLIGLISAGSYSDLYIWSALGIGFGLVFIIGNIAGKRRGK